MQGLAGIKPTEGGARLQAIPTGDIVPWDNSRRSATTPASFDLDQEAALDLLNSVEHELARRKTNAE